VKALLRPRDVAVLLDCSIRKVQRLIKSGKLCATIRTDGRWIKREDFLAYEGKQKALAEPEPKPVPQVSVPAPKPCEFAAHPAPFDENPGTLPKANPDAPLTNCPDENSSNWPAPQVLREHYEHAAQNMISELRGDDPHEKPHEYETETEIGTTIVFESRRC